MKTWFSAALLAAAAPALAQQDLLYLPLDPQVPGAVVFVQLPAGAVWGARVESAPDVGDPQRAWLALMDPDDAVVTRAFVDTSTGAFPAAGPPPVLVNKSATSALPGFYKVEAHVSAPAVLTVLGPPGAGTAVMFANGSARAFDASAVLFIAAPLHPLYATHLHLQDTQGLTSLYDLTAGRTLDPLLAVAGPNPADTYDLWRADVAPGNWSFSYQGFPPIFANTAATAQALNASQVFIAGGPAMGWRVSHTWQATLAQLWPTLIAGIQDPAALAALGSPAVRTSACANHPTMPWVLSPQGPLRAVLWSLGSATTIPAWSGLLGVPDGQLWACQTQADCLRGTCSTDGQCSVGFDATVDRWDHARTFQWSVPGSPQPVPRAGLSTAPGMVAASLAFAFEDAHPCNGWVGQGALLYRAALVDLLELMRVQEDGAFPGTRDPWELLPHFVALALASPHLPGAMPEEVGNTTLGVLVGNMWQQGLARVLAPWVPHVGDLPPPQAAAVLLAAELLAQASGTNTDRALATTLAHTLSRRAAPSGRLEGVESPDPAGVGSVHLALGTAARFSGDEESLQAVAASYAAHGMMAASEPDGWMVASPVMGAVSVRGLDEEDHGGARAIVEDRPSVSVWVQEPYNMDFIMDWGGALDVWEVAEGGAVLRSVWAAPAQRAAGKLPWEDAVGQGFVSLDDELVSVVWPGWAAGFHVGSAAVTAQAAPLQVPPGATGRIAVNEGDAVYPFNAGLAWMWTPTGGMSVLSTNWSAGVHHGMLLEEGGQWSFEDHHAVVPLVTSEQLDVEGQVVLSTGALLYATRTFTSDAQGLSVALALEADEDLQMDSAWEVIPVPVCTGDCTGNAKAGGGWVTQLDGSAWEDGVQQGFQVVGMEGARLVVQLDRARMLRIPPVSWSRQVQHGSQTRRLEVLGVQMALPIRYQPGMTEEMHYRLAFVPPAVMPDGGVSLDAGGSTADAAEPPVDSGQDGTDAGQEQADAGVSASDAGATLDAGPGSTSDAATRDGGNQPATGMCSCRQGDRNGGAGMWVLFGMLAMVRVRRQKNPLSS